MRSSQSRERRERSEAQSRRPLQDAAAKLPCSTRSEGAPDWRRYPPRLKAPAGLLAMSPKPALGQTPSSESNESSADDRSGQPSLPGLFAVDPRSTLPRTTERGAP